MNSENTEDYIPESSGYEYEYGNEKLQLKNKKLNLIFLLSIYVILTIVSIIVV